MKKLIFTLLAIVACMSMNAQVIKLMKNGAIVSQLNTEMTDKIVFDEKPTLEYVDLGLRSGIKWATFNVGALNPWDNGDYFAWGETNVKAVYDGSTYSHEDLTQIVDGNMALKLEYDVAQKQWGGNWRMPTKEELEELMLEGYTNWSATTLHGVGGYMITSKENGNSIFLPFAGYKDDNRDFSVGHYGHYWSSSLVSEEKTKVHKYTIDEHGTLAISPVSPYNGCSVRPVWDPNTK